MYGMRHEAYPAVDRILYKLMHHGGDGRVKDKRDKEEEPKDTDNGQSSQEQGSVILYIIQPRLGLFCVPHGGVNLSHGG